jgi:predicted ATP-binding protein involved in virulence
MAQNYRVEALALYQVGVFDDVEIKFKPIAHECKAEIHVFTGPNGCGKSTLLYALAEIFDFFRSTEAKHFIRRRFRNQNSRVDFQFADSPGEFGVRMEKPNSRYGKSETIYSPKQRGSYFCSNNLSQYKTTDIFSETNKFSPLKYDFAAFAYSGQRSINDIHLEAIQQIKNSPFEMSLSFDTSVRPQVLLQWIANNRTQSALAKMDKDDKASQTYDQALNRITNLIHDICGLDVEFRLERSPLAVAVRVNGDIIRFDCLPDGLKSIISWVADLSLRLEAIPWSEERDVFAQPIILFLDEVDIHLHPKWQRRILPAIQTLLPNAQIFVSTHSPFVVGSVEDAWVYRLPEPGQGTGVIEGIPSGAGKSYRLILDEVFGIDDEFDVETELLFDEFYKNREGFLKNPESSQMLLENAAKLAGRGEEAALIVDRELRQISRLSGQELHLA